MIVAANRDEHYQRPTRPLHKWQEPAGIVGGRDLQAGGSWMAIHQSGRFAAVTNVRDAGAVPEDARSRGSLVTDYLTSQLALDSWLDRLHDHHQEFAGFNLLLGDIPNRRLVCYGNQSGQRLELTAGLYGLSNGLLDEPWPKVARGKALLQQVLMSNPDPVDALMTLLADRHQPEENELPNTGVSSELEQLLAPITIHGDQYGTCSSSVLLVSAAGQATLSEVDRRPQADAELSSETLMITP